MMKATTTILFLLLLGVGSLHAQQRANIQCSWYHWDPYQHLDETGALTGLDYALITTIFEDAGITVHYDATARESWAQNQQNVFDGTSDVAAGAFKTEERQEKYHISVPYRFEWNALYVRSDDPELARFTDLKKLLAYVESHHIKVGVTDGYSYTSPEINDFVKRHSGNDDLLIQSIGDEVSFEHLVNRDVQMVVSDRIVGAQILWRNDWGSIIREQNIQLPVKPIHLLIHRDSNPETDRIYQQYLADFNQSVQRLQSQGVIEDIIGKYLFPVLMNITVQTTWFHITDLIGVVFFALAGMLIAFENRYDIFGVLVTTLLLSGGGGMLRDIIVQRDPAFLASTDIISIVCGLVLVGVILTTLHSFFTSRSPKYARITRKHLGLWNWARLMIESVAVGAYTIVGVGVAIEMQMKPFGIWGPLLGCMTACGGGVMASFLNRTKSTNMIRGGLEPEVSLLWGALFSQFLLLQTNRLNPNEVFIAVIATIAGCTATLMAIRFFGWKSVGIGNMWNPKTVSHEPQIQ